MSDFLRAKSNNKFAKIVIGALFALFAVFSFGVSETKKAVDVAYGANYSFTARSTSGITTVSTPSQLAAVARRVNGGERNLSIRLLADIDLSDAIWTPMGSSASSPYTGTFDGNGFSIKNLKIDESITGFGGVGLFGYVQNATIKDVMIVNSVIISAGTGSTSMLGPVAGRAQGTSFSGIGVEGGIIKSTSGLTGTSNSVGGLVGQAVDSTFKNSYSTAEISGGSSNGGNGGFVGRFTSIPTTAISNSYFAGSILTSNGANAFVGYGLSTNPRNIKSSYYIHETSTSSRYNRGYYNSTGVLSESATNQVYSTALNWATNTLTISKLGDVYNWLKLPESDYYSGMTDLDKFPLIRGVGNKTIVLQHVVGSNFVDFTTNGKDYFKIVSLRNQANSNTTSIRADIRVNESSGGYSLTWDRYTLKNLTPGSTGQRDLNTNLTSNGSKSQKYNNTEEIVNITGTTAGRQGYYTVEVYKTRRYFRYNFTIQDVIGNSSLISTTQLYVQSLFDSVSGRGMVETLTSSSETLVGGTMTRSNMSSFTVYAQPGAVVVLGMSSVPEGYHSPEVHLASSSNSSVRVQSNGRIEITLGNVVSGNVDSIPIKLTDVYQLVYPNASTESSKIWKTPNYGRQSFSQGSSLYLSYKSIGQATLRVYEINSTQPTTYKNAASSPFAYPVANGRTFDGWVLSETGIKVSGGVSQSAGEGSSSTTGAPVAGVSTTAQRTTLRTLLRSGITTRTTGLSGISYPVAASTNASNVLNATWKNNENQISFGGYYLNLYDTQSPNLENFKNYYKISAENFEANSPYTETRVDLVYQGAHHAAINEGVIIGKTGNGVETLEKSISVRKSTNALGLEPYAVIISNPGSSGSGTATAGTLGPNGSMSWTGNSVWSYEFGPSNPDAVHFNHIYDSVEFYVVLKRSQVKVEVDVNPILPEGMSLEDLELDIQYQIIEIDGNPVEDNFGSSTFTLQVRTGSDNNFKPVFVGQKIKVLSISHSDTFKPTNTGVDIFEIESNSKYSHNKRPTEYLPVFENNQWILKEFYSVIGGGTGTLPPDPENGDTYSLGLAIRFAHTTTEVEIVIAYVDDNNNFINPTQYLPSYDFDGTNNNPNFIIIRNTNKFSNVLDTALLTVSLNNTYNYDVVDAKYKQGNLYVNLSDYGIVYTAGSNIHKFENFGALVGTQEKHQIYVMLKQVKYDLEFVSEPQGSAGFEYNQIEIQSMTITYDGQYIIEVKAKEGFLLDKLKFIGAQEYTIQDFRSNPQKTYTYTLRPFSTELSTNVIADSDKKLQLKAELIPDSITYTVEHYFEDQNGNIPATAGQGNTNTYTGEYGEVIEISLSSPHASKIRTGNWFAFSSSLSDSSITLSIEENVYKVVYLRNRYTVKYDGNSGIVEAGKSAPTDHTSVIYGSNINAKTNTFEKVGHDFLGWSFIRNDSSQSFKFENGASVEIAATAINYANPSKEITLYAQWSAKTYLVYFEENGATSGEMTPQAFVYGVSQQLKQNAFERQGFEFAGWSTDPNATQKMYDDRHYFSISNSDVVLYTVWKEKVITIIFDANLDGASSSINQKEIVLKSVGKTYYTDLDVNGQNSGLPTVSGHQGFNFLGWYEDKTYTNQITSDTEVVYKSDFITLYGKWEVADINLVVPTQWQAKGLVYNETLQETLKVAFTTSSNDAYIANSNSLISYSFTWFKQNIQTAVQTQGTALMLENVFDSGFYQVKISAYNAEWGTAQKESTFGEVEITPKRVDVQANIQNNKIIKVYDASTAVAGVSSSNTLVFDVAAVYDNADVGSEKTITYTITYKTGRDPRNFAVYYKNAHVPYYGQSLTFDFTDNIGEITKYVLNVSISGTGITTGGNYLITVDSSPRRITLPSAQTNFLNNVGHKLVGGLETVSGEVGTYTAPAGFIDLLDVVVATTEEAKRHNYEIIFNGSFTLELNQNEVKTFNIQKTASLDKDAVNLAGEYDKTNITQGQVNITLQGVNITANGTYSVLGRYVHVSHKQNGTIDITMESALSATLRMIAVDFEHNSSIAQVKNWFKSGNSISNVSEININTQTISANDVFEAYYRNFAEIKYNNLISESLLSGQAFDVQTVYNTQAGTTISHPALNVEGLTFHGWFDSRLASATAAQTLWKGIGDTTLFAKWSLQNLNLNLHEKVQGTENILPITSGQTIKRDYDGLVREVVGDITNRNNTYITYTYTWKQGSNNISTQELEGEKLVYKNVQNRNITVEIKAAIRFLGDNTDTATTVSRTFKLEVDRYDVEVREHFEKVFDGTRVFNVEGKDNLLYNIEIQSSGVVEKVKITGLYTSQYVSSDTSFEGLTAFTDEETEATNLSNFNFIFSSITGEITKRAITSATIGDRLENNKVYDGSVLVKEVKGASYSTDLVAGHQITIKFRTIGQNARVYSFDEFPVGITIDSVLITEGTNSMLNNYDISSITFSGEAQITQATIDSSLVVFEGQDEFVYDAYEKFVNAPTLKMANANIVEGSMKWLNNQSPTIVYDLDQNLSGPKPINAGTYTAVYTLTVSENYIIVGDNPITKTFVIKQRDITINIGEHVFENKGIKEIDLATNPAVFINQGSLVNYPGGIVHTLVGKVITRNDIAGTYAPIANNLEYQHNIMHGQTVETSNYNITFAGSITILHTYTVVYNSNNGADTKRNQVITYNGQNSLIYSNNFTKDGYEFSHWNTNPQGSGETFTEGQVFSEPLANHGQEFNLYAIYQRGESEFIIEYHFEDIFPNESDVFEFGNDTGKVVETGFFTTTENYIVFERSQFNGVYSYVVNIYDKQGESVPVESYQLTKTFEGFSHHPFTDQEVLIGTVVPSSSAQGTMVFKLLLKRNTYDITYNYNNNSKNAPETITYKYGQEVSQTNMASILTPTREGWTFQGWTRMVNDEFVSFDLPYIVAAQNESVWARYLANDDTEFVLELHHQDLNGNYTPEGVQIVNLSGITDANVFFENLYNQTPGQAQLKMTSVAENGSTTTEVIFTLERHKTGFYLEETINDVVLGQIRADQANKLVLRLHYARNEYTYTRVLNNETPNIVQTMLHGNQVPTPAVPQYTGFTFEGWYTEALFQNKIGSWNFEILENITIYANYTPNTNTSYTINLFMETLNSNYPQTANLVFSEFTSTTNFFATVVERQEEDNKFLVVEYRNGDTLVAEQRIPEINFSYYGFKIDDLKPLPQTQITRLGNGVINLYLARVEFDITLDMQFEDNENNNIVRVIKVKYQHQITESMLGAYLPYSGEETDPTAFTFAGWYHSTNYLLDDKANLPISSIQDITLYARWLSNAEMPVSIEFYMQTATNNILDSGYPQNAQNIQSIAVPLTSFVSVSGNQILFHQGGSATPQVLLSEHTQILSITGYTFDSFIFENTVMGGDASAYHTIGDDKAVIKLYFTLNQYTFSIVKNGGVSVDQETSNVFYGQKPTSIQDPTKIGYVFAGWFRDASFERPFTLETFIMPAENITIYAKWDEATDTKFVIKYFHEDLNSAPKAYTMFEETQQENTTNRVVRLSLDSSKIEILDSAKIAVISSFDVLNFIGFTLDRSIELNHLETSVLPDGTGELRIYFRRNTNNLTLEYGYSDDDVEIALKTKTEIIENLYYLETYQIAHPQRQGYTFAGWYTNQEFVQKANLLEEETSSTHTMPDNDVVIYARWTANIVDYVVEYYFENINDSNFTLFEEETLYLTANTGASITANKPVFGGFSHSGQHTADLGKESGVVGAYGTYETYENADSNFLVIKLYYVRNIYILSFIGGAGSTGEMEPMSFKYQQSKNLSANEFAKAGHNFYGWTNQETSQTRHYQNQSLYSFNAQRDMELYALWAPRPIDAAVLVADKNMASYGDNITLTIEVEVETSGTIQYFWFFEAVGQPKVEIINNSETLIVNQINQSGTYSGYVRLTVQGSTTTKDTNEVVVSIVPRKVALAWDEVQFTYSARHQAPKASLVLLDDNQDIVSSTDNAINLPRITSHVQSGAQTVSQTIVVGEYIAVATMSADSNFEFVGESQTTYNINTLVWSITILQGQFSQTYDPLNNQTNFILKQTHNLTAEEVEIYLERENTSSAVGFYDLLLETPQSNNTNYVININEINQGFEIKSSNQQIYIEFINAGSFAKVYDGQIITVNPSLFEASNIRRADFAEDQITFESLQFEIVSNNKNVGSYQIELVEGITTEYGSVQMARAYTFVITPKQLGFDALQANMQKVYDGLTSINFNPANFDGVIEQDIEKLALRGNFQSPNAGQDIQIIIAQLEGEESGNYTLSSDFNNITGTIVPRGVEVVAVEEEIVYGQYDNFTLSFLAFAKNLETGLYTQQLENSLFSGSLSTSMLGQERDGLFTITIGTLEANSNYVIDNFVSASLRITKKEIYFTADSWHKVYDTTTDFVGTISPQGLIEKDVNINYEISARYIQSEPGENIEIIITVESGLSNYFVSADQYFGNIEFAFVKAHLNYGLENLITLGEKSSNGPEELMLVHSYPVSDFYQALPVPSALGYNFVGWFAPDGQTQITPETIVDENIGWTIDLQEFTFFAMWEEDQVDLTVNVILRDSFGSMIFTQDNFEELTQVVVSVNTINIIDRTTTKVNFNQISTVLAQTNLAHEFEYLFDGWFLSSVGGGSDPVADGQMFNISANALNITMLDNVVVYARFVLKADILTLNLNGNGDKVDVSNEFLTWNITTESGEIALLSKEFDSGTIVNLPATASRVGYAFLGWFDSAQPSQSDTALTQVEVIDSVEVFAVWEAITYTATFVANTGQETNTALKHFDKGYVVSDNSISFTKPVEYRTQLGTLQEVARLRFQFAGWYDNPEYTGLPYTENSEYNFASNRTFYALWEEVEFEISIEVENAVGATVEVARNAQIVDVSVSENNNKAIYTIIAKTSATITVYINTKDGYILQTTEYTTSPDFDFTASETNQRSSFAISRFAKDETLTFKVLAVLHTIEIEIDSPEKGSVIATVENMIDEDLRDEFIDDSKRIDDRIGMIVVYAYSTETISIVSTPENGYMLDRVSNITSSKLGLTQTGKITLEENQAVFENFVSSSALEVVFVEKAFQITVNVGKDLTTSQTSTRFGSFALSVIDQDNQKTVIEENNTGANTRSVVEIKTGQKVEVEIVAKQGFMVSQNQSEYIFENISDTSFMPIINFARLNENIIVIEDILQNASLDLVFERLTYALSAHVAILLSNGETQELDQENQDAAQIVFATPADKDQNEYFFESDVELVANTNKTKYSVVGWKETLQGGLISDRETFQTQIVENKTIYFVVRLNVYTVEYSVVGKGSVQATGSLFEVEHGQDVEEVMAVAVQGYSFARWEILDPVQESWFTDSTNPTRQDTNITQNISVRAVFEANQILADISSALVLSFDSNGNEVYAPVQNVGLISLLDQEDWFADAVVETYTDQSFTLEVKIQEGYVFAGWAWTGTLAIETISPNQFKFSGYSEDFTLEATFESKQNNIVIGFVKVEKNDPIYTFTQSALSPSGVVEIKDYNTTGQYTHKASTVVRTGNSISFNFSLSVGYMIHLENEQLYVAIRNEDGTFIRVDNTNIIYNQEDESIEVYIDGEFVKSDLVIAMFVELIEYTVRFHVVSEEEIEKVHPLVFTVESSVISIIQNNELLIPVREGYDFIGWYTANQEVLFIDGAGSQRSGWTPEITDYYAFWQRKTVIINVVYMPGSHAMERTSVGYSDTNINYDQSNLTTRFAYFVGTEFETTSVVLTASVESIGYQFRGWYLNGEPMGGDYSLMLEFSTDQSVFEYTFEVHYAVRIQVLTSQYGEGFIDGQKEVYLLPGEQASLTATHDAGYEFLEWLQGSTRISTTPSITIGYQSVATVVRPVFQGKKVEVRIEKTNGGTIEKALIGNVRDLIEESGKLYARMGDILYFNVRADIGQRHTGFVINSSQINVPGYTYQLDVDDTEREFITISATFAIQPFNYRFEVGEGGAVSVDGVVIENRSVYTTNYFETINFSFWASQRYQYREIYIMKGSTRVEIPSNNISLVGSVYTVNMPTSLFGVEAENTININYDKLLWIEIAQAFEGAGTEENPYIISTAREFAMMARLVNGNEKAPSGKVDYINAYYRVVSVIDFEDRFWIPIGTAENPFAGKVWLDYARYNIHLDKEYDTKSYDGLFGHLDGAQIIVKQVELRQGLIIIAGVVGGLIAVAGVFIIVKRVKRRKLFERSIAYRSDKRRK